MIEEATVVGVTTVELNALVGVPNAERFTMAAETAWRLGRVLATSTRATWTPPLSNGHTSKAHGPRWAIWSYARNPPPGSLFRTVM